MTQDIFRACCAQVYKRDKSPSGRVLLGICLHRERFTIHMDFRNGRLKLNAIHKSLCEDIYMTLSACLLTYLKLKEREHAKVLMRTHYPFTYALYSPCLLRRHRRASYQPTRLPLGRRHMYHCQWNPRKRPRILVHTHSWRAKECWCFRMVICCQPAIQLATHYILIETKRIFYSTWSTKG